MERTDGSFLNPSILPSLMVEVHLNFFPNSLKQYYPVGVVSSFLFFSFHH